MPTVAASAVLPLKIEKKVLTVCILKLNKLFHAICLFGTGDGSAAIGMECGGAHDFQLSELIIIIVFECLFWLWFA
jgi:hypothetical protein